MSKRQAKSQASSARAASSVFGAGFGTSSPAFGTSSSQLSYVTEPPDLSFISDSNVVVYFRNLSKKDSTTKAKALEDIQSYVSSLQEPVEEGILEAWIKIYPRTSIDNAKSVRQNAQTLHGLIAASAGKRVAKYMPKSVGAWLCGLYDTDRSVVEATQNSLRQVFNTNEKIQNIRRAYQQPILGYCCNAIDRESALTLSDERTVSPDDAEAKYIRVISACIALLGSLLANLKSEELSKYQSDYESLLADAKIWGFASHTDPVIRRSMHRFLKICIAKEQQDEFDTVKLNLEVVSKAYLSVALNSDQIGSAYDYLEALFVLTLKHPKVWTVEYKSKTPVERRLRQYLKKGSQSGPREFWDRLVQLFRIVPREVLPRSGADAEELLNALHGGIVKKDEPRSSLPSAFSAYLDIAAIVSNSLSKEDQEKFHATFLLPIVSQYLDPTPDNSDWTLPPHSEVLISEAMVIGNMPTIIQKEWPRFAEAFVGDIKTSAPEQSKDYKRSQDALIQQAIRFSSIQEHVLKSDKSSSFRAVFSKACRLIVSDALAVAKNRNGKPYGAAGAVAEFLHRSPSLVFSNREITQEVESFVQNDLPNLILSPSSTHLVNILYSLSEHPAFEASWNSALQAALNAPESSAKAGALEAILTSPRLPSSFNLAVSNSELQSYVKSNVKATLTGSAEWDSFGRILQSPSRILSASTTDEILSSMTQSLSISAQATSALQGFRQIVKLYPSLLRNFVSTSAGSELLKNLLLASESPYEEISQEAATVNASIQTLLTAEADSKKSVYNVIQHGLRNASHTSVSIETLVDLAKQLVKPESSWEELTSIFPNDTDWGSALTPFLQASPRSSLAITNPLSGAVYLAQSGGSRIDLKKIPRDADGYSSAFRIAQYVAKIFVTGDKIDPEKIPLEVRRSFLHKIILTLQLASDNLGLAGANHLWAVYSPDVEADVMSWMKDAHQMITAELKRQEMLWEFPEMDEPILNWALELFDARETDNPAEAYYVVRACSVLIEDGIELLGWNTQKNEGVKDLFKKIRAKNDILSLVAFLNAFKDSLAATKACERMCNELIANITGLNIEIKPEEGLRQLVLLNTLLYEQDVLTQIIAKQRAIFFVKHVVLWLRNSENSLPIRAESCRALAVLLPLMSDIYGEHWGDILDSLAESWAASSELDDQPGKESSIPFVHASLKLYACLRTLTQEGDPNDDLVDAWKESEQKIATALVNLLKHSQHFPDDFHQPLKIVNDVLARQIARVSLEHLESSEELFPLLYVESQPVQQTTYDILHKQIPAAQEQISIEAALEKTISRLPEELLSLILEAPTLAALADTNFERSMPLPLRGYLLSWLLIFDHLEYASFKVKNDYIDHIKEGEYLPGLLNFTFDFLGHSHNKPVDVSKLDITTWTPDLEPPKRDTLWLLTHLYFLSLRHMPSLTKAWWISCKSRPIVVTLEPWTEKYISPPVISAALQSVTEWAEAQYSSEPDSPFTIRVSPRAREITASYTVDEQTMSMRITLPAAFPLANAHIEGLNRVAVNEQKWQSWIRTSLGAITLFNGSLIDALTTFKRNVDGAVKGQTECAICYSIVGSDRKLPDKRCSTCKNLFHGACLFRWFKTSGSSSCPLCRNPFNYG
ncbi:hypothetical protein CC78DRAFT_530830 [Lojkania enalia]|uniref:E3 ubiquitin-protein ligase listerin n=1 Tax=Lojkania enalia TaxID=147567 RepID=A0A9P4N6F9_9PLEO|nr:hypothetical protein CC78DRAFT_530830 [Didymosphaeria enalia]